MLVSRNAPPPGAVRRDCEPHRGGLLCRLGTVANACGFLTWLALPGLVAVLLGCAVWWVASRDLSLMRTGLMNPAGRELTERARWRAGTGVLTALAVCAGILTAVVGAWAVGY